MKISLLHASGWLLAYLVLAVAPMVVAYAGPVPAPRGFWFEFSVGLGFVGLAMMALQFVLTGRFRSVAASAGLDSMLQLHRQLGLAAFFFILAHPLILFVTEPAYLAFLDPRVNLPRAVALSLVMAGLVLLIVTTIWRQPMKLTYEWWRSVHGLLALMVTFIGVVHILQVGHYVSTFWKQVLWVVITGGALMLLVNTRIIKPLRMIRKPWRVAEVRVERGDAWTLVLAPAGHAGLRFAPGQFVWLTLGDSPFTAQQHPFSISSSAERPARVHLTVKALGDFTARIGETKPGTTAFLEGPYGAFTPDPEPSRGITFIVGGVGITPVMSMLRTFRDRGDRRPLRLVYCNPSAERTLFYDELEALREQLDLTLVHVVEQPPAGWTGEVGMVTPDLIDRHLPANLRDFEYFVCGPEPMMDAVEPHLRHRGVPLTAIYSERFHIV